MNKDRQVLRNGGILWEDGQITMIDSSHKVTDSAKSKGIDLVDAKGAVVFPGLINTHNHLFQHLLKGLGEDLKLEEWWPKVIGSTSIHLREKHLRAAVLGGILEALRSGTTTIVDYMQVHPVRGLSDVEIETARASGIRLIYGRGFRNFSKGGLFSKTLVESTEDVFHEVEDLKKRYEARSDGMTKVFLAPAAAWGVTLDGLKETCEFSKASGTPITMHVFETDTDNKVCIEQYGMPAIDYFEKAGLLSPTFLAVHCVRMKEDEIRRFAQHGVKVSHNPLSNMYLASGAAPVPEFRRQKVVVSLATDGAASNNSNNMLEVLKGTALLHKVISGDSHILSAMDVLGMATIDGAKAIGMEDSIGSLEVGKRADLFLFSPVRAPTSCPMHDPAATLVYSSDSRSVVMTVVDGRVLLRDYMFTGMDEEAILKEEQDMAEDLVRASC